MGLGLAKSFVIFLFFSLGLAYWTKNWINGVVLMFLYGIVKIIWIGMTQKSRI